MDTKRYMISDAARLVDVEAHVLRYWEDELELPISRNEMGHRYYTEDNIQMFHFRKGDAAKIFVFCYFVINGLNQ